jgi:membrane protease YdiL (CAAX protease family)
MRGNAARALLPGLAVLALVAVVAVASTGSTPAGSGAARGPADAVLDTVLTLTLLLFVLAFAMLVYAFIHRKELRGTAVPSRYRRRGVASLLAFFVLLAIFAYLESRDWLPNFTGGDRPVPNTPPPDGSPPDEGGGRYEPEIAWVPILVISALVAIAAGAALFAARRRRPPPRTAAATLADVLDDTLDDLRAEADPRRAVIAAYARLERVLGAHGLPKHPPETPEEYLARILPDLEVDPQSIRRLTDLFTWAKFSQHEVGLPMKEEAIDALSRVRDDLRAADARDESLPQALPAEWPA